uniref:T9SS type A sorting domain-containing protein n=1 Tax=Flavobacterium sp. TaxID=239 RepID=UPI00404B3C3B
MKKIYFFTLTLLMSFLAQGQATDLYFSMYGEGSSSNKFLEIYNGTADAVDLSGYSVELYSNGSATASNTQTFPAMTMLAAGDVYVLRNGSSSLAAIAAAADITSSVCNFNGDDAVSLSKAGVVIDVIGAIGTDPGTSWPVGSTTVGTLDKTLVRKLTVCSPNAVNLSSFGTTDANSEWDVFSVDTQLGQLGTHAGCSTAPALTITSPANATVFNPTFTSVNIGLGVANFVVANGTGDGYITYSVNSATAVDKFDDTDIALTSLTPGMYSVVVNLVDNSGNPLSPAVSQTVNFEIASYTNVSNILALRADVTANGLGKFYNLTGEAFITYARGTRNQKYIQDATAAVLIDDAPGTITTSFVIGDGMTGLKAQTSAFGDLLQLNPIMDVAVSSTGTFITPEVVTANTLNTSIEAYESELVVINGSNFTTADGTLVFATNTNYNLNDGDDIVFRALFAEADYIGQIVPSGNASRVVLVGRSGATVQVTARDLADVTLSTRAFDAIDGLTMYPNPLTGNTLNFSSAINAEMNVQIFDILGKQVLNAKVNNNTLNVSNLNAGVYIVKITEEGKTATRKLIVQ